MNIPKISFTNINFRGNSQSPSSNIFYKSNECDSCSFTQPAWAKDIDVSKLNEKAHNLKEEMEDYYSEYNAESTLFGSGIKTVIEDFKTNTTYIHLNDKTNANGVKTEQEGIFKNGKLVEVRIWQDKGAKHLGDEKFFYSEKTGKFTRYNVDITKDYINPAAIRKSPKDWQKLAGTYYNK